MRTIKFRGKPLPVDDLEDEYKVEHQECLLASLPVNMYDGSFVYGSLVFDTNGSPYIVGELIEVNDDYTCLHYWIPVIPETVGLFTGKKDDGEDDIYDGDIIRFGCGRTVTGAISWSEEHCAWIVKEVGNKNEFMLSDCFDDFIEKIGNIYENQELLNGDQ